MSRLINGRRGKLYRPRFPFSGALVGRTAGVAVNGQNVPWDLELFDVGDWFGVNTTDMAVPKDVSFARGFCGAISTANAMATVRTRLNGADVIGSGTRYNSSQGASIQNCVSAILPVVGGKDKLTAFEGGSTTYNGGDGRAYFGVEAVDPRLKKALIYLDVDGGIPSPTFPNPHGSKVYDIGGWWRGGLQFVVPRGCTGRVRVTAQLTLNGTGGEWAGVYKNGAFVPGSGLQSFWSRGAVPCYANMVSAILECVPGDRLQIVTSTVTALLGYPGQVFNYVQIEELPLDHDYALVYKTANQSFTTGSITFSADGLVRDTAGIYRPGATPNVLTVPLGRGYKYGRFSYAFNTQAGNNINYYLHQMQYTGSTVTLGNSGQNQVGTTILDCCGITPWLRIAAGDTFGVYHETPGSAATIFGGPWSWMQLELRRE